MQQYVFFAHDPVTQVRQTREVLQCSLRHAKDVRDAIIDSSHHRYANDTDRLLAAGVILTRKG